jgi:hypothetical protein
VEEIKTALMETAQDRGEHGVVQADGALLYWSPPVRVFSSDSLLAYRVYRTPAGEPFPYEPLAELDSLRIATSYADTALAPGTYHYVVTSVYQSGESGPSNEIEVMIEESPSGVAAARGVRHHGCAGPLAARGAEPLAGGRSGGRLGRARRSGPAPAERDLLPSAGRGRPDRASLRGSAALTPAANACAVELQSGVGVVGDQIGCQCMVAVWNRSIGRLHCFSILDSAGFAARPAARTPTGQHLP